MTIHMLGWQQSVDQAAMAAIAALADTALSLSGTTGYFVPRQMDHLHFAFAVGPNLTRAQIRTPSIGVHRSDLEIVPARRGTEVISIEGPRIFIPPSPLPLIPGEVIQAFTAEDGAGATQQTVFAGIGPLDQNTNVPDDLRAVRLTGTTTLNVRAWTQVTLTPDTTLEAGEYELWGIVPISANVVAARMVFEGGGYRPGNFGPAQTAGNPPDFDLGRSGRPPLFGYLMGTFRSTSLPTAEFYATAADTAETVIAYVKRTGDLLA